MITRRPLREEVRGELLKRVLNGDLPGGSRLKEVALADGLGVSRTPLREALRDLEHMGIVSCTPGRGYAVRVLSADEARDAFPMLISLEALAFDGLPITRDLIRELDDLNRHLAAAAPGSAPELDLAWHRASVAHVGNARLRDAVIELQACAQRYEFFDADGLQRVVREHDAVARALELILEEGDHGEAVRRLRQHRKTAMRAALDRLDQPESSRRAAPRTASSDDSFTARAG